MSKNIKYVIEDVEKFSYATKDFGDWYAKFTASADAAMLEPKDRYMALQRVLDVDIRTRIMTECREAKTLPSDPKDQTEAWLVGELRKRFSYDDTRKHLAEVLSRLRDKGFQVKRKKCIFAVSELPFLGHVVGNGKLGLDMEKVAAVKKLAPPRNGKELQ